MYLRYKSPFRLSSLLCSIAAAAAENDGGLGSLEIQFIHLFIYFEPNKYFEPIDCIDIYREPLFLSVAAFLRRPRRDVLAPPEDCRPLRGVSPP